MHPGKDGTMVRLSRASEGTGGSDMIHPIWALLALSEDGVGGGGDTGEEQVVACELEGAAVSWDRALRAAVDQVPPGGVLAVTGSRAMPKAVLGLLGHARRGRVSAPSPLRVEEELRGAGFDVTGSYRLWPSSQNPRIATCGSRAASWIQRSGVLGGGGERMLMRAVARSGVLTPLVRFLAPGFAIVANRRDVSPHGRWTA
jgi:hypothetical protein